MTNHSRTLVCWCALAAILIGCTPSASRTLSVGCEYGAWIQPTQLGMSDTPAFVAVAAGETDAFVVSSDLSAVEASASRANLPPIRERLQVHRLSGAPVGAPARQSPYLFTRAALDSRGVLHLVWGEPDSLPSFPSEVHDIRVTSLWHSKWQHGAWSPPSRIYHSQKISWDPATTSSLLADRYGKLHLALPVDDGERGLIAYLRYDAVAGWKSGEVKSETPPVYTDLALSLEGELIVTYVAAPPPSANWAENALFLIRSSDGGVSWTRPSAIADSAEMPAYEPRLSLGANGQIHAVWVHFASAIGSAAELLHRVSLDGGKSWGSASVLRLSTRVNRVRTVVDVCNAIHVSFQASDASGPRIGYARFEKGAWNGPTTLSGADFGALPTLWLNRTGSPQLHFYQGTMGSDGSPIFRSVTTTLGERRLE